MAREAIVWGNDIGPVAHIIANAEGNQFPSRRVLRFVHCVVQDNDTETIVTASPPEPGPQGDKGDDGKSPILVSGTVTTLPNGDPASLVIRPNPENPVEFFVDAGIPQGAEGGKGDTGPMPLLEVEAVGLPPNSTPTATASPVEGGYKITFGIPLAEQLPAIWGHMGPPVNP
jgi:hypothetical protein